MGDGTAGLCSHLPCVADIAHTAGCHAENQGGDSVSHITYIIAAPFATLMTRSKISLTCEIRGALTSQLSVA